MPRFQVPRFLRIALLAAGGVLALIVIVFVAAFALLPRGYVEKEAQRLASNASGAKVTWTSLTPGFSNWSLGVRIKGLSMRAPAEGPTRLNARLEDVFVQFKLFPLLFRRVEIAAARVKGGGISMTDRGPVPAEAPPSGREAGMALVLPRVDVDGVDLRTRDALGGGVDLRRLHGRAEIDGSLQSPREIRVTLAADSLFWKPSSRDSLVALPSPLDLSIALAAKDGGKRLEVTDGSALLGPLSSAITGEIRMPGPPQEPSLALSIRGTPQSIRSTDPAIRPLAKRSPAAWNATASWDVTIEGPLSASTQSGRALLKPLSVNAQSNTFNLDQASASWTTRPDRTFRARAEGFGGGLTFAADASGSTTPGGAIEGTFLFRAPAERMNGLLPDTPTWTGGSVEASGAFTLRPPAEPDVRWTVVGKELKGTVPGVARPVRKLDFDVRGDAAAVTVRSFGAVVGATTASITGRVTAGKPLGTGTFQVVMDRFVADEWAPAKGSESTTSRPAAGASGAPPIPLRAFDASVRIGEVRTGSMSVRDMAIPVRYQGGRLTAEPITGAIGSGTVGGSLALNDFGSPKQKFDLHLDVKRAPVEEMASGLLPIRLGLSGLVSGIVDLNGPGMPGPEVGDSLRGAMSGTVENAAFQQGPVLKGLREAVGLSSSQEMAFKTLTHSFRIANGRLLLDKMRGDLGKDVFEMAGSLGFDQSLNMDLVLRLAPERFKVGTAAAQFARFAKDAQGRVPVNVKITGSTLQPKFSVKASSTLEGAGKALTQELVKGLAAKATPKTKAAPESAAAKPDSADSARQDALQKGRDALKRLLGK